MVENFTTLHTLAELHTFLDFVCEGTTCDVPSSDLKAGNFMHATFVAPEGATSHITYYGPVVEGYVCPCNR